MGGRGGAELLYLFRRTENAMTKFAIRRVKGCADRKEFREGEKDGWRPLGKTARVHLVVTFRKITLGN